MTEAHCQARLEWALAHRNWTTRKWRKVLFSDEITFTRFQQVIENIALAECFGDSWCGLGPIVPLNNDEHFPCGNKIFQEDNAPSHRSKAAMAAREDAVSMIHTKRYPYQRA
ncbi:unnamed protein product [Rhizophagus irregularis]|nr:unnamed protein product [Rhizophagus irregularis]